MAREAAPWGPWPANWPSPTRGHAPGRRGIGRWADTIQDGMRSLHDQGRLAAGVDPDDLAVTVLAALQGGLLLAQVHRDVRPLQTTLETILTLAGVTAPDDKPMR